MSNANTPELAGLKISTMQTNEMWNTYAQISLAVQWGTQWQTRDIDLSPSSDTYQWLWPYKTKSGTNYTVLAFITIMPVSQNCQKKQESKEKDCPISHGNIAHQVGPCNHQSGKIQNTAECKSPKKWVIRKNPAVYFDWGVISTSWFSTTAWSPTVMS